jgi:hypothetical protein
VFGSVAKENTTMAAKKTEKPWQRRARLLRAAGACALCARRPDGTHVSLRQPKDEPDLGPAPEDAPVVEAAPVIEEQATKPKRSRSTKTAAAT